MAEMDYKKLFKGYLDVEVDRARQNGNEGRGRESPEFSFPKLKWPESSVCDRSLPVAGCAP